MWKLQRNVIPTLRHPVCQSRGASYQEVHHVWLVVPQRLDSMEDIHSSLVSEHLTDNADGTECTTAASSVPAIEEMRRLDNVCDHIASHSYPEPWSEPQRKVGMKVQREQAGLARGSRAEPHFICDPGYYF